MSTPTRTAARWKALILEHETSGLSTRDFARDRGVNPSTLAWWRSRLRRRIAAPAEAEAATFLELHLAPVPPTNGAVMVRLDRLSASFCVDTATDLRLVRALLEALC